MLQLLRAPKKDGDDDLEEVVVLAKVLGADINFGYQDMGGVMLTSLNGKKVKGLADLGSQLAKLASMKGEAGDESKGARWLEFDLSNRQARA